MSLPAATRATVEALVRTQRQRADPDAEACRVIGVQARPEWAGPSSFPVEGRPSGSPVPIRARGRAELSDRSDPDEWLVLLTDRDPRDLGIDVMARLARRRLQSIDAWTAVAASFDARTVTPPCAGHPTSRARSSNTVLRRAIRRSTARCSTATPPGQRSPSASWA